MQLSTSQRTLNNSTWQKLLTISNKSFLKISRVINCPFWESLLENRTQSVKVGFKFSYAIAIDHIVLCVIFLENIEGYCDTVQFVDDIINFSYVHRFDIKTQNILKKYLIVQKPTHIEFG